MGPEGDEPHYLMVADSLLRDHDLSLEHDYAEGRYAVFHDAPLAPHYRVRGRDGEIYSLHAVGLSILILPAWALAGYAGVTVFMALLAALVAREVREWVRALTGRDGLAEAAGWLAVLTPPLAHYAGLVFTEVPAALALSLGLRVARRPQAGLREWLAVGFAAAALPWLNVRYGLLAMVVVSHALWRSPRVRAFLAVLAPCAVSAAALLLHHHRLYGFWNPSRVYGRHPEFALGTLREGLPGLLLDQEFGLLVYAPVLVLALPGLVYLFRRDRRARARSRGCRRRRGADGRNVAHVARRLQSARPLPGAHRTAAAGRRGARLGEARSHRRCGARVGLRSSPALPGPRSRALVHRDRDGTAPLFRQLSGAREWTGLLPAYVLEDPDRHRLALVWALALVAAIPWRARQATAGRLAVACLGLVRRPRRLGRAHAPAHGRSRRGSGRRPQGPARAGLRARSRRRSVARRGRRLGAALRAPSLPGGGRGRPAPSARRRTLSPRWSKARACPATPPALVVGPDRPEAPVRAVAVPPRARGVGGRFQVRPGERAVSLMLQGGGPALVRGLAVLVQPPAAGPV